MKLPNDKVLAALAAPSLRSQVERAQTLDAACERWIAGVTARIGQNEGQTRIRTAFNSVIVRSRKLSQESSLAFDQVAIFLLRVTLNWIDMGRPLNQCITSLPEDLRALGIMKMSEDAEEANRVMGKPQ